MDVRFKLTGECIVKNVDKQRTADEIEKMLEVLLYGYCGISAVVQVSGLTYTGEGAQE